MSGGEAEAKLDGRLTARQHPASDSAPVLRIGRKRKEDNQQDEGTACNARAASEAHKILTDVGITW